MKYLFAIIALTFTSCSVTKKGIDYSPKRSVTSSEALAIAESYRTHIWLPNKSNAFHGYDTKGILVNTPDVGLDVNTASRPGWWIEGKENKGIPYKWGGFDTPISFDKKISQGYYAGDVYTQSKRSKLYSAVSDQSCGIDCSGFISRCWRLSRPYSTRELPSICKELASFDNLRKGDIINKHNTHVLLFERFIGKKKKYFIAYDTGSPPSWRVLRHIMSVYYLKKLGYKPYQYKNIEQSVTPDR